MWLPSWRFDLMLQYANKHRARTMLDDYQVVSVGAWGDKEGRSSFTADMKKQAGYDDKPHQRRLNLPTQKQLREKMQAFNAVVNLPTVDQLLARRSIEGKS